MYSQAPALIMGISEPSRTPINGGLDPRPLFVTIPNRVPLRHKYACKMLPMDEERDRNISFRITSLFISYLVCSSVGIMVSGQLNPRPLFVTILYHVLLYYAIYLQIASHG